MATPYMNLILPTVGPLGTQGPDWANEINAALDYIDAHDHSSGNGKQITPAGININQTFPMNGYQVSQIASLALQNLSAAPSGTNLIYDLGGELYFKDKNGTAVQITSGGAINVSSVGGIGGDYSTTPGALVSYSNTSKGYSFLQAPSTTAFIDCGALTIYRNTVGSPGATIQQQASQTGNLTWSLPDNYPASTLPIKSSNAGVLTIGQIITADITDANVTAVKLASDSVETAKIKDLNVTTGKLADLAVTAAKIANQTITSTQIASNTITSGQIASNTLLNSNVFASANIERSKLRSGLIGFGSINTSTTNTLFTTVGTASFTSYSNQQRLYNKPTNTSNPSVITLQSTVTGAFSAQFKVVINGIDIQHKSIGAYLQSNQPYYFDANLFDADLLFSPAGTNNIQFQVKSSNGSCTVSITNLTLYIIDL